LENPVGAPIGVPGPTRSFFKGNPGLQLKGLLPNFGIITLFLNHEERRRINHLPNYSFPGARERCGTAKGRIGYSLALC